MSLRARTIGKRLANLPIIPIPIARSGNNKPKSLQKTKRTFQPNLTRVDWPVTVLGGPVPIDRTKEQSLPKLEGILMQVRKIRDVEKAGGIEGLLLSRRSKDLTPYGASLRAQLFESLHEIRREMEGQAELSRLGVEEERLRLEDGSPLASTAASQESVSEGR
ncbi:hypothetical protein C349_03713 [Cryptococcus neoformans var. grubii Br795]|uniref:Uncharacterized protein n=1 Tax=Cryptococcus neoformans Tu259-1 TaxID=1230072 RepID=A0A854QFN5_CRYNE|nr:hypothetical protein C361_03989 [Cryptococcus neoformans var. grubii Tu259-1]OXG49229.1 hypothetical protein C355_03494 [Cryptococcus neoformans var. grubii Th84]OXG79633.1 hypothetical protein C350_03567 [Cryptococcus neoformans var. grubii MW-RSA36]OXG81171.1 hypothetical protein C349_03713 [Cryptococcus neoformans var. grubii Br795]OXG86189.1 hypothetical protein C346_03631 [Cryptococcus neoformans var. grubii D17-1]OXG95384.1 hypothetical protein C345_03508 [Cryptococcus neoformans var.